MIKAVAVAWIVASALAAQNRSIGIIDFYGYSGLDLDHLRAILPFHEGDAAPSRQQLAEARGAFTKAIDRRRVEFTQTCCLSDGKTILDVGIEEPDAPPLNFNSRPSGDDRLPAAVLKLYQDHQREIAAGIRRGVSEEDVSQGYRLSAYEPARAVELQIREYAQANSAVLIAVLKSSADDLHRTAAAQVLGYATVSSSQTAALVYASLDPNKDVRDNATRALADLAAFDPKVLTEIPVDRYVTLLHSVDFFDRNKACSLIEVLTQSRDPKVLGVLRARALTPLMEMAQWKISGHAMCAFESLGRVAGLDENQIVELEPKQDIKPILRALH
jgi:hypothetical protein